MDNIDPLELIREAELRGRIRLSHSTIWRLVNANRFPKPIQLTARAKAWRRSDVEAWLVERAEASEAQ